MWLKKVSQKFRRNEYKDSDQIFSDIKQIWANCMLYNHEDSLIYKTADLLDKETDEIYLKYKELIAKSKSEEDNVLLKRKRKLTKSADKEVLEKKQKEEEDKPVVPVVDPNQK